MEFSNYFPFVAALVTLFIIFSIKTTESSTVQSGGYNFQEDLDHFDRKAVVGGDGNIVIQLGQAAINTIKQEAELCKASGGFIEAVDVLLDGLIDTIKLIAHNGDDAFDLIDKYKGIEISDPEEAIDDIDRGIRKVKQSVYHSGVPGLHAFGAAGVIAPGATKKKLQECLEPTQDSGTAIFNSLDATQTLAIHGLKSTKRSLEQGLKAAHSAIVAGTSSLFSGLIKASKLAFDYLADIANGKIKEVEATADALSSRAKTVARDPETLSVIDRIDSEIYDALIEGLSGRVLNEIRQGVLGDIESSALGISAAFRALEEARKLAKTDSKKALNAIEVGFEAARKGCIDGSVRGYQGFGGAAYLVGQKKVFAAAIEFIENSRIDSTDGIEAARKLANMGIISGGDSTEQGLKAAHDAVEAIEIELYTKISNAQKIALKILEAVTNLPGLI